MYIVALLFAILGLAIGNFVSSHKAISIALIVVSSVVLALYIRVLLRKSIDIVAQIEEPVVSNVVHTLPKDSRKVIQKTPRGKGLGTIWLLREENRMREPF